MSPLTTRRRLLAGIGLFAGASLLAACGASAGGSAAAGSSASGTLASSSAVAASSTSAAVSSAPASSSAAASSSGSAAATTSSAASSGASTSAAAASAPSGTGVTLQYLGQGDNSELKIYQTFADNFHKENPEITIQIAFATPGGSAGVLQKLETLVAANSGPDAYWTHSYIGSALYKKGISLVLDPFLQQDKTIKLDDYFAAAYLDYTFDGKHTALPREIATNIMYYRTDLFDKAGIKYPDANWTWDEMHDAAQKLTSGQSGSKVYGFGGPVTSSFMYRSMSLEKGSDIVDKQNLKSLFANQPVIDAIQYFADYRSKDHTAPTTADLTADKNAGSFQKGLAAIAFSGYYLIGVIKNDTTATWPYDCSNMPIFSGGKRFSASATSAHSAWSGTKHSQESWQWVKYLSGPEASKLYGALGLVIPPLKALAESDQFTSTADVPHHRKAFIDDLANAEAYPIVPNWTDVLNVIGDVLQPVWDGKMTAKEAIDAGNGKINAELQKNA